jgi:phage tail sheath protein FI
VLFANNPSNDCRFPLATRRLSKALSRVTASPPDRRGRIAFGAARVITGDPEWKYVNVRRRLIFIEGSIDWELQWVVFEPNVEPLWAGVDRALSNPLSSI